MRRLLLIFVTLLTLPAVAEVKGVTYFQGTVTQALEEAARKGKLLLVEFYAPWSYKSRWAHDNMMNNSELLSEFIIFSQETASVDGAALANAYEVYEYPNILIFNKNGNVLDRIDRTMEPEDFETRLSQVLLATDGRSTLQLRQIYMAATKDDEQSRIELNVMVNSYLYAFYKRKLDVTTIMDIFTSTSINYYGSEAFRFMTNNREMFDSVFVEDRTRDLLLDVLLGFVTGTNVYDELKIKEIVDFSETFACATMVNKMAQLAKMRHEVDAVGYVQTLDSAVDMMLPQYQYPLILSLDFIDPATLDKSMRRVAARTIEKLVEENTSDAKNLVIGTLLDKFL